MCAKAYVAWLVAAMLACACGDALTAHELAAISCGKAHREAVEWAVQTDGFCNPSNEPHVKRLLMTLTPGAWVDTNVGYFCCDTRMCARLHSLMGDGNWSSSYTCGE